MGCRPTSRRAAGPFPQQDYEFRRSNGELRQRVRGIYEIPGRGYGDDPATRVRTVSVNDWIVTLDVSADEYWAPSRSSAPSCATR